MGKFANNTCKKDRLRNGLSSVSRKTRVRYPNLNDPAVAFTLDPERDCEQSVTTTI